MNVKRLTTVLVVIVFILGLGILLYPTFSDLLNQFRQDSLIDEYIKTTEDVSSEDLSEQIKEAEEYNSTLDPTFHDAFSGKDPKEDDVYWSLLNIDGNGIMGYMEIPKISVRLPIYHGTSERVLQHGLGHLAGTSLPVGGKGTHSVVSGHRGLPSALLLTDIDRLTYGDRFSVTVLGEKLVYQVDKITVIEPDKVSDLKPEDAGDYITLLTCTPYGINSHRLLVRGCRVEGETELEEVSTLQKIVQSFDWKGKLLIALAGIGFIAFIIFIILKKRKKKGTKEPKKEKNQEKHIE